MTAQQLFKEVETGKWRPFYLVVGEEPFQAGEILARVKKAVLRKSERETLTPEDSEFRIESWDGESLDSAAFLSSLNSIGGLFDEPGSVRLVVCSRFDRIPAATLESLESYFADPSTTTCLLLFGAKADKRRAWYRHVEEKGAVVIVEEPTDRDWPKWQAYFERRLAKRISPEAWEIILTTAERTLSLVWAESEKLATYVGDRREITGDDARAFQRVAGAGIFDFVDDVVARRASAAMARHQVLLWSGESDIKLLSLLVRQFRLIGGYHRAVARGTTDPKVLASELGLMPFLVGKVRGQASGHKPEAVEKTLELLAEADYRMKTGDGSLFENFLVPYFHAARA